MSESDAVSGGEPDDDWDRRMSSLKSSLQAGIARTKAMQDLMTWTNWRRAAGLRMLAVVGDDGLPPTPPPTPPERLAVVVEFRPSTRHHHR